MTNEPGIYALVIRLAKASTITLGRFGTYEFPKGWYVYLGSAFGAGGLKARTDRHRRSSKKNHWHVDFLLEHATIIEIWFSHDIRVREHDWAQELAGTTGARVPVPGFGSQDCKAGCWSHLVNLPFRPVAHTLRHEMKQRDASHKPIYVEFVAPWRQIIASHENVSPVLDTYLRGGVYLERRRRAAYDGLEDVQRQDGLTLKRKNRVGDELFAAIAADSGVDEISFRKDAEFAECVDEIISNCGHDAYQAMFCTGTPQLVESIKKISRKSRERQRHRVEEVLKGNGASIAPHGKDKVPDTKAFWKLDNRVARTGLTKARMLMERDGANLGAEVKGRIAKLVKTCDRRLATLRRLMSALQVRDDMEREPKTTPPTENKLTLARVERQLQAGLGLLAKNIRDVPAASYDIRPTAAEKKRALRRIKDARGECKAMLEILI